MATKSSTAALVNHDAGTIQSPILVKPRVAIIPMTYAKVAGNTDGDQIQFWRVHSSWAVLSMKFQNAALTGCTDTNIGLWSDLGPALSVVVAESAYADALTWASALAWAEQAFQNRTIDKIGQQVWQDAGLSADPSGGRWYRIAANLITGGTATGSMSGLLTVALPS